VSPRVPWFQTHLPVQEGSSVATCHMALGVLWATGKREILGRSTYSAGHTYLRGVSINSWDACRLIMTSLDTRSR
jgi:hypothetical protein